jgi:hypothetical protein
VAASSFKAMRAAMSQGWSGCLWAGSAEATRCCGAAKRVHTKAGSKQCAEHDTRRLATARYKRRALHRQPVSASRLQAWSAAASGWAVAEWAWVVAVKVVGSE